MRSVWSPAWTTVNDLSFRSCIAERIDGVSVGATGGYGQIHKPRRRGRFFSIADEVIDCGDHLKVRRSHTAVDIPFSQISSAEVSTDYRMHRITVYLRGPTKLGTQVEFWPLAGHWGNLPAVQRVAMDLSRCL